MKVKTADLSSHALQLAVARCEGWVWHTGITEWFGNKPWLEHTDEMGKQRRLLWQLAYDTDGALAVPIIEREKISVIPFDDRWEARCACTPHRSVAQFIERRGPTPLIAAMRCYVASKLGEEVEVPDSLV